MEIIRREFVYLWYYFTVQFEQIFIWWILGMVIGSAVSVFAKDRIHQAFRSLQNKEIGVLGIVAASALGIASPLCMYGTIPIAASFSRSGMKDDWLAAFMMSSILLNPQLIIYSAALGQTVLAVRVISCFLCGIAAGLLIRFACGSRPFFRFEGFDEPKSRDTDPNLLLRYLKNLGRNVKATGIYFLFGILLSALFQRYMPSDVMRADGGHHRRASLCLRRRNHSPFAAVASGWNQSGKRRLFYAYRTFYEDYEFRGAEDRAGISAFSFLSYLCDGLFFFGWVSGKSIVAVLAQHDRERSAG